MSQFAGLKVREAISLLPGAELLAGAAGLNRVIQSVGLLEAPEGLQFMKEGDLVLTTLWAIRHDREAQIRLVPELVHRGIAALAIKQTFIGELPYEVLAQADAHGFPVLQLDPGMPFSEATLPLIGQIVNRQALALIRQQKAHKAVMQAMLEAKGLQRLADTLVKLVENPVVIQDQAGVVLAVGSLGEATQELDLESLAQLDPSSTDYMLSASDTLHNVEVVAVAGRRFTRIVTPIRTGNLTYGQVQAWEIGRPLGELDLSIIDSVTTVIALEMSNRRALAEVERRYHNEFLVTLFSRSVESESEGELQLRARRFGWDLTRPYFALALKATPTGVGVFPNEATDLQVMDQLYDAVNRTVGAGVIMGQAEQHMVILVPTKDSSDSRQESQAVANQLKAQVDRIRGSLEITLGVGTVQNGLHGLRRSFHEARQAISVGERVGGPGGVVHYSDLGFFQILGMLQPTPELHQFLAGMRRLIHYDAEHHTELVKTLEAYFDCKGNVRRVAADLYTHYNTILYRLQRIEEIAGSSLEDASDRLHLQVALHAVKLFGASGPK